jgi:hypothetical protein
VDKPHQNERVPQGQNKAQPQRLGHSILSTHFMEIYWLGQQVWGRYIDPKPTNQYREEYEHCFSFAGKTACFFFVTGDDTIRREDALAFATRIAKGELVYCRVDFSSYNNWHGIDQ